MRVMQLIDTLDGGGAERVAIAYANMLCEEIDKSYLCATRREGILKDTIHSEVKYLFLSKQSTLDVRALNKLASFIQKERIDILQAHNTSYFLATVVKFKCPELKLIWHNHHGASKQLSGLKFNILKWCSKKFDAVFTVNETLKDWAQSSLKLKPVFYIRNFINFTESTTEEVNLAGNKEHRIIYLANLRPPKNHLFLCAVFLEVIKQVPTATLHFVGKEFDNDYAKELKDFIKYNDLTNHIFIQGEQKNPISFLNACKIGVMPSKSEGLPMSLLEYGSASLAVITSNVGQCGKVVGDNGIVLKTHDKKIWTASIIELLLHKAKRELLSKQYNQKIKTEYSRKSIQEIVLKKYRQLV